MQKLPKAPDRKRDNASAKRNPLGKRKKPFDRRSVNITNHSYCGWKVQYICL